MNKDTDYIDLLQQVIVDGLGVLKRKDVSCKVTELGALMCEAAPVCKYFDSKDEIVKFIGEYWGFMTEEYKEYVEKTGKTVDVFKQPDEVVRIVLQKDASRLAEEIICKNTDKEALMDITDGVIDSIRKGICSEDLKVSDWVEAEKSVSGTWEYDRLIKNVALEGLNTLKGQRVEQECLYIHLCEAMDYEGEYESPVYDYFDDYNELEDFINENLDKISEVHKDSSLNIFKQADELVYLMIEKGVGDLISQSEIVDVNSTDFIEITDEVIGALTEELDLYPDMGLDSYSDMGLDSYSYQGYSR